MKRRSRDPTDQDEVDSTAGALVEKWIVPDVAPPTKKYVCMVWLVSKYPLIIPCNI